MLATILKQLFESNTPQKKQDLSDVNLAKSKIYEIGQIPTQISKKIKVLNLGNNHLKNIQGIEQFIFLEKLNLTNNKILEGSSILCLQNLLHLKKVFLKGNPFLDKPLNQELLSFLGSFQNDLQILSLTSEDLSHQSLIKGLNQNKSLKNTLKQSAQQNFKTFSKAIQVNKSIQRNKINILLNSMQEFIEQKQQSQQISNQSVDNDRQKPQTPEHSEKQQIKQSKFIKKISQTTPIKPSPKFGQFKAQNKQFSQENQSGKFQQQSTRIKYNNVSKPKIKEESSYFESNAQSCQLTQNKFFWMKDQKQSSSPQRRFKYQVNNLKINMQADHPELNYPSITQKQDQNSFQIQFDFMSPQQFKESNKRQKPMAYSPSIQLKQITANYMKIQEDSVAQKQNQDDNSTKRNSYFKSNVPEKQQSLRFKQLSKGADKKIVQDEPLQSQQPPVNTLHKKGSLYESTKSFVPQTHKSNTYQLINNHFSKAVPSDHKVQIHSFSQTPYQILQNIQKFDKFYFNSLIRLKPAFNLLYSPFSSLKVQQKDLLLQELFKNHKQIFMLLIREFYSRSQLEKKYQEQLKENLEIKFENDNILKQVQQFMRMQSTFNSQIDNLTHQNEQLKKQLSQSEDIIASRQKLINDVEIQYQKVNKNFLKKDQLIQKYINEDQLEQKILQKRQNRLKKKYLEIICHKATRVIQLKYFEQKRQLKAKIAQEKDNFEIKSLSFTALKSNLLRQMKIKSYINKKCTNTLKIYFNQFKKQAKYLKFQKNLKNSLDKTKCKQFFVFFGKLYLNKTRLRKLKQIFEFKIKRNLFFKGFKKYLYLSKRQLDQYNDKAIAHNNKNIIKKYFIDLKNAQTFASAELEEKIQGAMSIILKKQFLLLMKISKFQEREDFHKCSQLVMAKQILNKVQFFRKWKSMHVGKSAKIKNIKISQNYRLKKIFKSLKNLNKKNLSRNEKNKRIVHKLAHQSRIKQLVMKFKEYNLQKLKQNEKICLLIYQLKNMKNYRSQIIKKQDQLLNFLTFRRRFKSCHNFINVLRLKNSSKRLKNRGNILQQHYATQQLKYKESYQLNILTIEQLKDEVHNYLNQIEFSKIQIQKLSQRQLFIMEEKQDCLIQAKLKQEENMLLQRKILQTEKQLEELKKKYEKSLDMYALAMEEISKRQHKLSQSNFLYDTIARKDDISSKSFAKKDQLKQATSFTSLRR